MCSSIPSLIRRSKAPRKCASGFAIWLVCLLHAMAIPMALAGLSINLGTISIPAGTATHTVDVMVTGGDALTDMVAYFQIGDGGPLVGGTPGPKITSIDLTGSIWSTAAGGHTRTGDMDDNLTYPTQFQEMNVSLNVAGQSVAGNGRLCKLILNTAGFSGTYALKMSATLGGDTTFKHGAATVALAVTNGSLAIGSTLPPPLAPHLTIQRLPAGTLRLSFPAEAGRSYTIQWDSDLTPPWTSINPPLTGATGATLFWTDDGSQTGTSPAAVPMRFYRLLVN
ncbi:MAG: hypothetical protein NTW21_33120 [Verrucomicrobia bacterium]|nr:hypothetical protein [Verrucomicrobiota bacterium]